MAKRQSRVNKRGLAAAILLALALCLAAAFFLYVGNYYHADEDALALLQSPPAAVTVLEQQNDRVVFIPEQPIAGLIFYPGGKVQVEAYAPLMEQCAEKGLLCVLLRMPCNLAVLNANAADGVMDDYPEIADWYIGGHSLGGAIAASYAAAHPGAFRGLILLAAYSTLDISESGLRVLSLYGSEDGVLNWDSYTANLAHLPADRLESEIPGGNHAYFGCYGAQEGDGVPTISNQEQIAQTVEAISRLVDAQAETRLDLAG